MTTSAPATSATGRAASSGAPLTVGPVFAVATAALVVAVGTATWLVHSRTGDVAPVEARGAALLPAPAGGERRQLLLEAPGGTRIIWMLNESFQLR